MNELHIRFFAPVLPQTIAQLFQALDFAIQQGVQRVHLLLSSPGGSVFHGLSAYNFLRGAPFEVFTYNFGSVDSIGVVMFCAGRVRRCVPHARFLIHPVQFNMQGNIQLSESQLEEHLKGLRIDQENIARVVADTTGKPLAQIIADMHHRATLNPGEAQAYGLVHEITSALVPAGARLIAIGEPLPQPGGFTPQPPTG